MADETLDFEVKFEASAEAGTFSGYASVFGGQPDGQGDVVAAGAFRQSLADHKTAGSAPLMFWQHDDWQPIGVWTDVHEDAKGLKVSGRLVLDTERGREAHALMKAGAINGLSIGYRAREFERRRDGGRLLKRLDLVEISLVSLPANGRARVTSVKTAATDAADTEKGNRMEDEIQTEVDDTTVTIDMSQVKAQLDEVEAQVKAIDERAGQIEVKLNRPGAFAAKPADDEEVERKAFERYLRGGETAMAPDEVKTLRVGDNVAGGYLAPDQMLNEIQRDLVLFSPVRSAARVSTTSSAAVILPKRTGTLTAQWVGETETRPSTEPAYGSAEFAVRELACYVDVSAQMLEDSAFDIEAELAFDFAEEFGRAEGAAFVNGDGAKKPFGFMQDPDIGATNGGHASQITSDGLIDLYHALPTFYAANAVWGMNRTTIGDVRKLKDSQGRYLWVDPISEGNPPTILGRPVVEMPDLEDVAANAHPVAFGDFRQGYRIFDRQMLQILRDPFTQRTEGKIRFHAWKRVAGGVGKAEAIRKLKIAT